MNQHAKASSRVTTLSQQILYGDIALHPSIQKLDVMLLTECVDSSRVNEKSALLSGPHEDLTSSKPEGANHAVHSC